MPGIKLIAVDIDGTLLGSRHELLPENASAIRDACDAGIHVVLASSRPPRAMVPLLEGVGVHAGCAIALQGSMVLGIEGRQSTVLSDDRMHLTAARNVMGAVHRAGGEVNWFAGNMWFAERPSAAIASETQIVGFGPHFVDLSTADLEPHKLLILSTDASDEAILRAVRNREVEAALSKPGYIEVTKRGIDKGQALRAVMAYLRVNPEAAMAIGDGANDLPMFRVVDTSVAMGNAHERTRSVATYVTTSNDEAGVARAIRALAL